MGGMCHGATSPQVLAGSIDSDPTSRAIWRPIRGLERIQHSERHGIPARAETIPPSASWPTTAMTIPHLPQEILDYVTDLLHDERETLMQCCLVSKSWIPRTRKHLFADISFHCTEDLETWKNTFPDPADSPARHTRSLLVGCPESVTAADAEEGGWIRAFSRVVRLEVWGTTLGDRELSLVPFHSFSSVLKSLQMVHCPLPRSRIFNLICSLPLLEDLGLSEHTRYQSDYIGIDFQPSTSLPLTGTLELYAPAMEPTAGRLLDLPGGLHFRKLVLTLCLMENLRWIVALVARCSDTLESFDINNALFCMSLWLPHWERRLTRLH